MSETVWNPIEGFLSISGAIWRDESNQGQRLKRLMMFVGWQLWKRLVRLPVIVPTDNGFRFIAYPDCDVSPSFFYYRTPNAHDIHFLRAHIRRGVFIDVGGHVGSISILLADKIDHAILFEPNPIAAARARENLVLNHLPFDVHELAVSDTRGTVELEDDGGVNSCNRTVIGFETETRTRTVSRLALDDFFDEHPLREEISAIKIDVEGHENAVIRGMRRLLESKRPPLVMFEYLERTNLREVIASFAAADYIVFELTAQGPSAVESSARPLQNLFACPKESFSKY